MTATSLIRVFSNLLNNAIKYSDGDLDITLTDSGEVIFANTASRLNEYKSVSCLTDFIQLKLPENRQV